MSRQFRSFNKDKYRQQRRADRELMKEEMKFQENVHIKIIMVVIFLCAFGVLMIYSASAVNCANSKIYNYDALYFVKKHLLFLIAGMVIVVISLFWNFVKWIDLLAWFLYLAGVGSVFMLKTSFAVASHGAYRWIRIAGIQFQPAEVAKIGVIAMMAFMVRKFSRSLGSVKLTIYMWALGGFVATLVVLISSDLSSGIIILAITYGITFITNKTFKFHIAALVGAVGLAFGYVYNIAQHLPTPSELDKMSYRIGRIAAWVNPERYAQKQGYQVLNSLYAIGSGGWFGKGLGKSVMKLDYIPEAHNDMIFSIICEELGVFGGVLLMLLFIYLLYMMYRITVNAETLFEAVIVAGVFMHIASQSFINMAVAVNLFPNTGVPLPFISYGGTSILCNLAEIAIVVRIAKNHYENRAMRAVYEDRINEK